ncbi:MAG: EthD domain-containing protein [Acidobacteriota bacterium]
MIRLVYCVARRQDVDLAAFRKYWEKEHVALVDRCAEVLKPRKYTQAATLLVERNWRIMEMRGTGKPFDGMLEFWWDDAADYESVAGTRPAREAIDELFTDEKRFIDHAHSRAFFTEEFRIVECCPYRPGPATPRQSGLAGSGACRAVWCRRPGTHRRRGARRGAAVPARPFGGRRILDGVYVSS